MTDKNPNYEEFNDYERFVAVLHFLRGNIRQVSGAMDIVRIHDELAIALNKAYESYGGKINLTQKQVLQDHCSKDGDIGTPLSSIPGTKRFRTWGRIGSNECHDGE